jgi:hypothetical protein
MIDRKELKWVFIFTFSVILLTTLPYAIGYLRQNPEWKFTGLIFNLDDGNSYLAKMLRGAAGDWLFRTPYTTIPQSGVILFLPYLLLGKLTSPPGQYDQIIFLFHLFRWVGIAFVIYAFYQFIAHFVSQISLRRWGTVLVVFGGGAGWLALVGLRNLWGTELPLEFYSPETFGFLSFLGLPHLLFSRALLICGFSSFLFAHPQRKDIKTILILVLPWFLIGFFQPMSLITGWAIIGSFLGIMFLLDILISKRDNPDFQKYIRNAIWIAGVTAPFVIYNFLAFRMDPVLQSWLSQNILKSPPVLDYFLAFLFVITFALIGLLRLFKTDRNAAIFFGAWVVIFPLLAYFPLSIQRRLPEGIWIALVSLSIISISYMSNKNRNLSLLIISLGFITTLIILVGSIQSVIQPNSPRFVSKTEQDAFRFLQNPEFNNKNILASFTNSNKLPAWVPVFVLTGHGPESVDQNEILPRVTLFLNGSLTNAEKFALLKEFGVNIIYFGPEDRKLFTSKSDLEYLEEIYSNEDVGIYSVKK